MVGEKQRYVILRKTLLNDKPFKHNCRNGSEFVAERCDFKGGVKIIFRNMTMTEKQLAQDVAEMIGWHATNIYPNLNGFAGYDCIDFTLEPPESVRKIPLGIIY